MEVNWTEAIDAMRAGNAVERKSLVKMELMDVGDTGGVPVYECGPEPFTLMHAWTDDDKPVRVLVGVNSRVLAIPDTEHTDATDWEIAP